MTDSEGRYRFVTIMPGHYPVGEPPQRVAAGAHPLLAFGTSFLTRLVTQMYFPGDPLQPIDPILNSIPDPASRQRLVAKFDIELTQPDWALGLPVGHRPARPRRDAAGA